MKILMANSIRPEVWGGGEKWFLTAADGLRRRGHEVTVAGRRGSLFLARTAAAGHRVEGFRIRLDYGWGSILGIRRLIRRRGIERVLLNVNKDIRTFGVAARWERVPLVACRHGARVFSDRWKDRFSALFVDRIIVNNLALRDEYSRYAWLRGKPLVHLPNGIESTSPAPAAPLRTMFSIPENHLLVLAAGRLSFEKGFDLLVSAAALMGPDPPFTVILAGEGPEEEGLRRLAEDLNLGTKFRLAGFQEEIRPWIAAADVVVLPSRHEGMPHILMEAMAEATPAVAFRVGGVAELMGEEAGWLAAPGDPAALAAALKAAFASAAERFSRGRTARKRVGEHYSLERMLDGLEKALKLE